MRVFGCSRFKRLASEQLDRDLTPREEAFLHKHRQACPDCHAAQSQSSAALNFLRAATIEVDVHPLFDERVIRKLKVQKTRESLGYWSPAFVGAFIAGLAVIAALQMITRSADLPHVRFPGGESHLIRAESTLSLDKKLELPLPR